jgi:hypothetical protein
LASIFASLVAGMIADSRTSGMICPRYCSRSPHDIVGRGCA